MFFFFQIIINQIYLFIYFFILIFCKILNLVIGYIFLYYFLFILLADARDFSCRCSRLIHTKKATAALYLPLLPFRLSRMWCSGTFGKIRNRTLPGPYKPLGSRIGPGFALQPLRTVQARKVVLSTRTSDVAHTLFRRRWVYMKVILVEC